MQPPFAPRGELGVERVACQGMVEVILVPPSLTYDPCLPRLLQRLLHLLLASAPHAAQLLEVHHLPQHARLTKHLLRQGRQARQPLLNDGADTRWGKNGRAGPAQAPLPRGEDQLPLLLQRAGELAREESVALAALLNARGQVGCNCAPTALRAIGSPQRQPDQRRCLVCGKG